MQTAEDFRIPIDVATESPQIVHHADAETDETVSRRDRALFGNGDRETRPFSHLRIGTQAHWPASDWLVTAGQRYTQSTSWPHRVSGPCPCEATHLATSSVNLAAG